MIKETGSVGDIMNAYGNVAKGNVQFLFVIGKPVETLDALPIILDELGDGCVHGGVCASFVSRNVLTFERKKVCRVRSVIGVVALEC